MNNTAIDESGITFRNETERALFTEARLGQEAINFLSSDLGRLLQGRAQQEKEWAMNELLRTESHDEHRIRTLQNKAQRANQFIQWIGEAIQNGKVAEQQIEDMEPDEDQE